MSQAVEQNSFSISQAILPSRAIIYQAHKRSAGSICGTCASFISLIRFYLYSPQGLELFDVSLPPKSSVSQASQKFDFAKPPPCSPWSSPGVVMPPEPARSQDDTPRTSMMRGDSYIFLPCLLFFISYLVKGFTNTFFPSWI